MVKITLDTTGDTVTLSLTAYLGGNKFTAYRNACFAVGFRAVKEPQGWVNRGPVLAVPQLVAEFERSGLVCEIDTPVIAALREQASEAKVLLEAGRDRVQSANARLAGRNLRMFRYQETGVEWLAPRASALLCDEMGLGKTVQVLIALPEKAAALVVVSSAVRYSWQKEVERWRPDLRVVVVSSKTTFRWPVEGEVVVTTYGMLPDDAGVFGPPPVGMVLVADEAHALKNRDAQRTRKFDNMVKQVEAFRGKVWLVTGTPLLNRPTELWQLMKIARLEAAAFGNWFNFCRLFNGRQGAYGYEWGQPSAEVPDALRKVMLHRRRQEVLADLPGKTRIDIPVNGLDKETVAQCDKVLAALNIDLEKAVEEVGRSSAGVIFEEMSKARRMLAVSKIPSLLELVEEYEEQDLPLVVFSCHREPIEALRARKDWGVIMGDTSSEERGRIVEAFQNGLLKGIAGTVKAMGVGVTLTHAHHVLMVDLDWTPALNCQAEDRVCRIGQKAQGVFIKRLIAKHPLDERVAELLTIKQEIIEKSVEASAVEAEYSGASPAEALVNSIESIAAKAVDMNLAGKARAKAEAQRAKNDRDLRIKTLHSAGIRVEREVLVVGKTRSPANDDEAFAAQAMVTLAGLDPDFALEQNGVGFSKFDGDFGHSLATQVQDTRAKSGEAMLTDRQWVAAVKMANRYRKQVGELPSKRVPAKA